MASSHALSIVAVLNGPNLNMPGPRQPEPHGLAVVGDVEIHGAKTANVWAWQSISAGPAAGASSWDGCVSAVVAPPPSSFSVQLPAIEVHITNIHRREGFRQHSFVAKAAASVIGEPGILGFARALTDMARLSEGAV